MEAPGSSLLAPPGREAGATAPWELGQRKTRSSHSLSLHVRAQVGSLSSTIKRPVWPSCSAGSRGSLPRGRPEVSSELEWGTFQGRRCKADAGPPLPMDALAASCDCGGSGLGALPAASPLQAWRGS